VSYLDAIDKTGLPLLTSARLPNVDLGGRLDPDAPATTITGNVMLLACEDAPLSLRATSGRIQRVDLLRFFAVYPTRRAGRVVQALPDRIDLVRFASVRYADRASLDAITDATDKHDAVLTLRA